MQAETIYKLLELNRNFYHNFGEAFAATRRRIQPGIRRLLEEIPPNGNYLDVGCGSGALALEWANQGRQGMYFGLDFRFTLLGEAQVSMLKADTGSLSIRFAGADLSHEDWPDVIDRAADEDERVPGLWDGALAFAVLHHIPGIDLRLRILRQIRNLLKDGANFYHSEWQFQHSEKLMARRQPWNSVGIEENAVDEGDTLLDWRHVMPEQEGEVGLRYVHLFNRDELAYLAKAASFEIIDEFESDGQGGKLGLYQTWQAI